MLLRVSGEHRKRTVRTGTSDKGPWTLTTDRILVNGEGFADVTVPNEHPEPAVGTVVDYAVEVYTSGKYLRCEYSGPWHTDMYAGSGEAANGLHSVAV